MHSNFSENRLLAQRMERGPANPMLPENLDGGKVMEMIQTFASKFGELFQSLPAKERNELIAVSRDLMQAFGSAQKNVFAAAKEYVPAIQHIELGGAYGSQAEDGDIYWNDSTDEVTYHGVKHHLDMSNGHCDIRIENGDGNVVLLQVYSDGYEQRYDPNTLVNVPQYVLGEDGVWYELSYADEVPAEQSQEAQRENAQLQTKRSLDDLRQNVESSNGTTSNRQNDLNRLDTINRRNQEALNRQRQPAPVAPNPAPAPITASNGVPGVDGFPAAPPPAAETDTSTAGRKAELQRNIKKAEDEIRNARAESEKIATASSSGDRLALVKNIAERVEKLTQQIKDLKDQISKLESSPTLGGR